MKALERLFTPISIGGMELRNRIAMAPMTSGWPARGGLMPEKMVDFMEARARGGAGLLILETVVVDKRFPYIGHSLGLWEDAQILAFKRLVDAVHRHGARLTPQISHPGPESFSFIKGVQPVGPSVCLCKGTGQVCRELTVEEIGQIVVQYGEAARRAREAGADGVELHAAHSYMLAGSFLSPWRNKRSDDYGGDADGRLRFAVEVLQSIKQRAGSDFPVIVRISGDEHIAGGRTLADTLYMAPRLVDAGADAFEVSGGVMPETAWRIMPPNGTALGLNVPAAAALKEVVDVPVLAVGRINSPQLAEDILRRGGADIVSMGRALLADPDLPNKARDGRCEDIMPCTGCSLGCIGEQAQLRSMTCVINPMVGREKEAELTPAAKTKRVLVAGGGPGGLEAARVAAMRGHEVTLCEKSARLGGQLNLAVIAPAKQELVTWIQYLARQATKAGVRIELNREVTPELVEGMAPDALVVATGGIVATPPIPGADQPKVVSAWDVLTGRVAPMRSNVLIIGGGSVACEVADSIAGGDENFMDAGNRVTIVEMLADLAHEETAGPRTLLMQRLREKGVVALTSTTVKAITADGAIVVRDGREETLSGMDHIVLACGTRPVDGLSVPLAGKVGEVHVIGDAKKPRRALEAIAEGSEVGRAL